MALILKAKYEQDTRRLTLRSFPTFEQLEVVIRNLFAIPSQVGLVLRYEDEDKDLITISSMIELEEAISIASRAKPVILRLFISKSQPQVKEEPKQDNSAQTPPVEIPYLEEILRNPQTLTKILSCPEVLAALQQKLSDCKGLPANMNDLIQMFGNLGVNASTDQTVQQMRQQMQVFLQAIMEIPFVKELISNLDTSCANKSPSEPAQPSKDESIIHFGVICDNCGETIVGIRYKCSNCPDFDLCEKCEPQGVHFPDHVFLKVKRPLLRRGCPYRRPDSACGTGAQGGAWRNSRNNRCRTSASHPIREEQLLGRFVTNVSVKDGTQFTPGQNFVKIWRMRNEGTVAWPENTRLAFVGGDKLSVTEAVTVSPLSPGEDTDIVVDMSAPTKPGRYVSYWRLAQPNGDRFGQRIWVDIVVAEDNNETKEDQMVSEPIKLEDCEATVEKPVETQSKPEESAPELIIEADSNVQKFLELGFSDASLVRAVLEVNENDFFKTLEDLFNLNQSKQN